MVRHALRRGFLLLIAGSFVGGVVVGAVAHSLDLVPTAGVIRAGAVGGVVAVGFLLPVLVARRRRLRLARENGTVSL